ncbi:ribosome recycling factor [Acholeplasma sp. OttesenSCG-928-E16]|nr:ribosome recycling factor [Acholeplasma sp. OttesenSCG-928-E16]
MNEQADLLIMEVEERMQKSIDSLVRDYGAVRTGRANPTLLDRIAIDYYGVSTPLKQISSVAVVEGNQLLIKPFDKSTLKQIEQAIYASDLGLNPQNDGTAIRLILPQLTEERRKELIKEVEKMAENGKVAIRNIRRDVNEQVKKLGLTEDDEKGYLEDVQSLTDKYIKKVEEETKIKSEEIIKI